MMSVRPLHRSSLLRGVAAATVALVLVAAHPAAADDDDDTLDGSEVVVKLAAGVPANVVAGDYALDPIATLLESRGIHVLRVADGRSVDDAVDMLDEDPRVVWAEPNVEAMVAEADPRMFGAEGGLAHPEPLDEAAWRDQDAGDMIGLAEAHTIATGAGVAVAVLDTGAEPTHPLLRDRLVEGYDYIADRRDVDDPATGIDEDGNGAVDEAAGHGTHVAGIVALAAPDAAIMPLRVLDDEGHGWSVVVAEAVADAVGREADVIVASLGIVAKSKLLKEAVKLADAAGVVVVASAGNRGGTDEQWPAANDEVVAVAAADSAGRRASFSNYGSWVRAAAPGVDVLSAYPTSRLARWDGTSMAAPFVGGLAALLLDAGADPATVHKTIVATGRKIGDGLRLVDFPTALGALPTVTADDWSDDREDDD